MSVDTREASPLVSSRFFPKGLDQGVYELISRNIARQRSLEEVLVFDDKGRAPVDDDLRFVIDTNVASYGAYYCAGLVDSYRDSIQGPLHILDVGGGIGTFITHLQSLMPHIEIDGTVLSLTDFFSKLGIPVPPGITLRQLPAEFPDDDMYQAYDIVSQFSGPLQWSQHPQIVADNMAKMVRPGGFLFYQANPNYHGLPYQLSNDHLGDGFPVIVTANDNMNSVVLYHYQEVNG